MKKLFGRVYTKSAEEYNIKLSKYMDGNVRKFIITANPETFMLTRDDNELMDIILNEENDVIPDGIAIVKTSKYYGVDVQERITGIDTTLRMLELANNKKKTLFLFGGTKEVLEKLTEKIKHDYPSIKILGAVDGYVDDKDAVMEMAVGLNPDVCLVALGIPLQEKLIAKYIEKTQKGIYMGVGGTFDVLSGVKKRAPKIFIKLNMEWFYRIVKEPKRIKRFWRNNVVFIWKSFRNRSSKK